MTELRYSSREWAVAIAMLISMCCGQLNAQVTPQVEWQRCIGGSDLDQGSTVVETSDGGLVCLGYTNSIDGDAAANHGDMDILVTKLDANGALLWTRCLGGSFGEYANGCIEASDGSIMILGNTRSADGDVTMNQGENDLWVIRLSPAGNIVWQRTYGGSGDDIGYGIEETAGGGFILHGPTTSADGDVAGSLASPFAQDHWVLKISSSGTLEWSQALGGTQLDNGTKLIQLSDGGFLQCFAATDSNDGDVTNNHGGQDAWLVKLSAVGSIEWARTIGGSDSDGGNDVLELDNGDILFAGSTASNDGDVPSNQGERDALLARISSTGVVQWVRTYGGSLDDGIVVIKPKGNGNFLLSGSTASTDGDVTNNNGATDAWLLEVDGSGSLLWQRAYGGSAYEQCYIFSADQNNLVLSGVTNSTDGPMADNHGDLDLWIGELPQSGAAQWQRCLGGSAYDRGILRTRTADGGYMIVGYTDSNDGDVSGNHGGRDMWVVKLSVDEPTEPVEPLACTLFVPNAFSPNNSTTNDAHCIYGTECVTSMTFGIYDRWGAKVFESTDPATCWDGTDNGQALDPAVFVYHLTATLANGERVEKQGNITLVR
ncbi:MAG: gliding motility-associated C-terminal domain-containing protein [Flavobacteriales bacterium]|nr:gliding motility-associated C-terminal domain-containing protein [Flavobacteriales bacterium]MBL0037118.1 gliding motility-associated C-terminal domain-containing protein [Flavobacteriales bacterium]